MLGRGNGMLSYEEDSPLSSGSDCSFRYSTVGSTGSSYNDRRMKLSSASDPGSPTLDDAILMGCLQNSPFSTSASSNNFMKTQEPSLLDLMNSLSLSSSLAGSSILDGKLGNIPVSRPSLSSSLGQNQSSLLAQQLSVPPCSSSVMAGNQRLNNCHNVSSESNITTNSPTRSHGMNELSLTQLQNMWLTSQLCSSFLDSSNILGGLNDIASTSTNLLSSSLPGPDPYAIEKAAKRHRNAAALYDATCTWSGQLPTRVSKNPFYSCKVFLGGVPWDITELTLRQAFIEFGYIMVEWPGKENSACPPRGYVYILFEAEKQVKAMLAACKQDSATENYYFKISSRRMRQKEVQVIPWVISDSNYVRCPSYQLDPAKTVFVGALHGMLSAEGLANIMNDLFGGVVYAGIDTDKHKYPIGSGRVTFNNVPAFKKAVRAAFIEIKTPKFTKKVQVDPYLADSLCQLCSLQPGPYFCRDESCFKYYCRTCWNIAHIGEVLSHKPLMRDPKLRTQTSLGRIF